MPNLYLVDVSSIFFRAFFALPPLSNSQGMPTNALYGFLSMTLKLLRENHPDYMAFCFDRSEPSFRSQLYPEYKAHRDEVPQDLLPQFPYLRKLAEQLGIPIFEKAGFEADDVIGTLTQIGLSQGWNVVIVSGDKDFAQLVHPRVTLYDTMKDVRYDDTGVLEKWGVRPQQMIDYLALVGDTSDNIPGVKGIGPKGAQKLLREFETLDGIYQNLDKISGKALKSNLEANRDKAYLSRQLVTLNLNVPLEGNPETLRIKPINKESLCSLLLELGFKTFAKTFSEGSTENQPQPSSPLRPSPPSEASKIQTVTWTLEDLQQKLPPYEKVWGLLHEHGFYLGFGKTVILLPEDPKKIGLILNDKHLQWLGFDLKTIWHDLNLQEPVAAWDSMLAAYTLRAGSIENFSSVYSQYCEKKLPDLIEPHQLYTFNLELYQTLKRLGQEKSSFSVLEKIEIPLIPVLYAIEKVGIQIHVQELARQSQILQSDIHKLEQDIFQLAGGPFNVASPKQLAQILFGKLQLPPSKKTKSGYSTDSDVLEKLALEHPIAQLLLEYRELTKLKSTYVDALPQLVNPQTQRIHTHFNQAGTTTGRLSSQNPNLQNIPIRTPRGVMIRKAFIASPGHKLISADYSQIELRILAHITGDPGLIQAFAEDRDIHTATASEIFGVPSSAVTPELRRTAKAVNFGIAYGQGAFGLAETLGMSRQESSEIIARYFQRFPQVKQFMEDIVTTAYSQGFVETIFGRRRYLDELKSKNMSVRKFGERAAINAPIQGTASDLVKMAMIKLHHELSIPMLLQVHDELIFESPDEDLESQKILIKHHMESVVQFKVPLKVNVSCGINWQEAHS